MIVAPFAVGWQSAKDGLAGYTDPVCQPVLDQLRDVEDRLGSKAVVRALANETGEWAIAMSA